MAIIDTPGMLDSMAERDRGYDYQEVIGDLAQIADLVLVLFDPHKAGTVREAHASLRDTLPRKTFEDRVIFVLNRIDECANLNDLLRVYGTLCWNLSQMTGRKDIPMIRLTYSPHATPPQTDSDHGYLQYLENQREQLKAEIAQAPKYRLDHLAAYVETHGDRLGHFLEGLIAYLRARRRFKLRCAASGLAVALMVGATAALILIANGTMVASDPVTYGIAGGVALAALLIWMVLIFPYLLTGFHRSRVEALDELTSLDTQSRRDSWQAVRDLVQYYLKKTGGRYAMKDVKAEFNAVKRVRDKGSREIREALNELSTIRNG